MSYLSSLFLMLSVFSYQLRLRFFASVFAQNAKNGVEKLDKDRIFMVYLPRIGGLERHGPWRLRRS